MIVRRSARLLGAMTAFAFAVSSCAGGNSGTTKPDQSTPSPSYYAHGVPYLNNTTLYINHKAQPGHWFQEESAGDFIALLGTDQSGAILRDGAQVERIDGPVYALRLSPSGTLAAWVESSGPGAGVLVVRDLLHSRNLGQLPITLRSRGAEGFRVSLKISDDRKVLYEVNGKYWLWTPSAGAPTRSAGHSDNGIPLPGSSDLNRVRRPSPDHLWVAWIPQGSESMSVQKPADPSSRFEIPMPAGSGRGAAPVQWDSPTVAFVLTGKATDDGRQLIIACDVTTRQCNDATDTYEPQ